MALRHASGRAFFLCGRFAHSVARVQVATLKSRQFPEPVQIVDLDSALTLGEETLLA
jgi:hypothetical protein